MLTLGMEPMQSVSEEYCRHALTRSANSGCGKQLPFRNIRPWKQSQQAIHLGKLMTFNSCLKFKFWLIYIMCVGVYVWCGVVWCVYVCVMRPISALIISRSCFASFPVFVYKFSSHYLNNIIFYRQQFGASSDRLSL